LEKKKGGKMKKIIICVFLVSSLTLFGEVKTEVSTSGPSVSEVLQYQGPKARISVGKFEVKAAKGAWEIGDGLKEMLVDALFKTGRFIVLESSENIDTLKEEFELGESGWSNKAPEKGTFETADIILTGAITAFEPDYKGKGGGGVVVPLPFAVGGGLKISKQESYIASNLRLVDVRTRRIIKTAKVEGFASKSDIGVLGGGLIGSVALGAGFQKYKNTPMEQAVMIMLENAVNEIIKSVPEDYYRYDEKGNAITANQQTATASQQTTEETKIKIVGGGDIFKAGEAIILNEDFNKYEIGDIPTDFQYEKAEVEIAEMNEKKWMRFLKQGNIKKDIKVEGDYSYEISFLTTFNCSTDIVLPDGKSIHLTNGKILYSENELSPISINKVNKIQLSKKEGITRIFVNDKRVYKAPEKLDTLSNGIVIKCDNVSPDDGKEFLFTDLKIATYK